jgi:hypothetical protein
MVRLSSHRGGLSSFARLLSQRSARATRTLPRKRVRLQLEALEGRTAAAVFTVTNTFDDGSVGSLRWAITQVNNDSSDTAAQPDLIAFNINAPGVQPIEVGSSLPYSGQPLPPLSQPVIINGFSQPGASPNTLPGMGTNAGDNAVHLITLDGTDVDNSAVLGSFNSTAAGQAAVDALGILSIVVVEDSIRRRPLS